MSSIQPARPDDTVGDNHWMSQVIVIMIGTHNIHHTARQIADGILCIANKAKSKQPSASIIVMGLLPCGREPNVRREKHQEVNKILAEEFSQQPDVIFLNPDWKLFIQPNETISHRDLFDYLHPTENGYANLAEPLIDELQNVLQVFLKTNAPSNSIVEDV